MGGVASLTSVMYDRPMNKTETAPIADDRKPMTGIWYRSTIDPNVYGKVSEKTATWVDVIFTGGGIDRCTIAEFADNWEII